MPAMLAAWIGGWEVVLISMVVLVVAVIPREIWKSFDLGRGIKEFLRAFREATDELQATRRPAQGSDWADSRLFIAQGFGIGRIPFAPGTFGSLVGLLWFALLAAGGDLGAYLAASMLGVALSVWLCGEAEKTLGERDPGSVVLDEIIAIPFCFLPWVVSEWLRRGQQMPPLDVFFSGRGLVGTVFVFALFRLFDIWKPWPVRQSQRLPGGWGVTVDDVLAGFYTALVSLLFVL
jgi:phosphatidylglycerophosphatase A